MNGIAGSEELVVKGKISREFWVEKINEGGFLALSERSNGDLIEVHTYPTDYHFEIVNKGAAEVMVGSFIDEEFLVDEEKGEKGCLCTFICSIWVDPAGTLDVSWYDADVRFFRHFVKNFCPVVRKGDRIYVLPPAYQVVISGEKFFRHEDGD